ncbi:MAG: YqgE/AlgH family protein [Pseudomonadota bacterium]|nr:YqgE/AlgH family protein [Pseudomonadota bacterium]
MRRIKALLIICLGILTLTGVTGGLATFRGTAPIPALVAVPQGNEPAPGMLLVAQRGLHDHYFGQTVILLLQHDASGSLGLIVNRKINLQLSDAIEGIDKAEASKHTLFFGGPLGTHRVFMLMRHPDATGQAQQIASDIYFSTHRDVLEHMLERKTPNSELRLFLGYSSWSAGQLAGELTRGSWHLAEGDSEAVFDALSNGLWEQLIETLEPSGIEVKRGAEELFKVESVPHPVGLSIVSGSR